MANFSELRIQGNLTRDSDFAVLAQAAIAVYYSIPYPGKPDQRPAVNRRFHGGLHASGTADTIDLLIANYQKFKPELLITPDGKPFSAGTIKLLKLAAIYHDSANVSESKGDAEKHAENFRRDMLELGYSAEEIQPFYQAILYKHTDQQLEEEKNQTQQFYSIFQSLLEDADRLQIIRVKHSDFELERLDIFQQLKTNSIAVEALRQIEQYYHKLIERFYGDPVFETDSLLHARCEYAENCYLKYQNILKTLLKEYIFVQCLKSGKHVDFNKIDLREMTIIDFYNPENSPRVQQIIETLPHVELTRTAEKETKAEGYLVRSLALSEVDDEEFQTLAENERILREKNITSGESLKKSQPEGLKWRPGSYIPKGMRAPKLFRGDVSVIIDQEESAGTFTAFFGKRNLGSYKAAKGKLKLDEKTGPFKDKGSFAGIVAKLIEEEKRRQGLEYDASLHYFGLEILRWTELLLTYRASAIKGIIIRENSRSSAIAGLMLRSKLGEPKRDFYQLKEGKLEKIADEVVIQQSRLKAEHYSGLDALVDRIQEKYLKQSANCLVLNEPHVTSEVKKHSGDETSVLNQSITLDFKHFDKPTREKIIYFKINAKFVFDHVFKQFKRFKSFDISVDDQQIHFSFSTWGTDFQSKKDLLRMQEYCLIDMEKALSSKYFYHDEVNLLRWDLQLENAKIPDIKCSDSPLRFDFIHPRESRLKCSVFVNEQGVPTLQIDDRGKILQRPTSLLQKISHQYYSQRAEKLNELLQTKEIKNYFEQKGMDSVTLKMETNPNKSYLMVNFNLLAPQNIAEAKKIIFELFAWHKLDKVKVREQKSIDDSNTAFKISSPDIQNIDKTINQVMEKIKLLAATATQTVASDESEYGFHKKGTGGQAI